MRSISDRQAAIVVARGESPFGEVAELRIKAARCTVGIAPGHEALIENLAPGMGVHRLIDVMLVEIGL